MSSDIRRKLKSIARDCSAMDSYDMKGATLPSKICFVVSTPTSKFNDGPLDDAYKASEMFIKADFQVFFMIQPDYPKFCEWFKFFLENTVDHLAFVLTGFDMVPCDGLTDDAHPFMVQGRDVFPKRVFSMIRKHKNSGSRVTILINGCPAMETWSGVYDKTQLLSFSTTSICSSAQTVHSFKEHISDNLVLLTACSRPDFSTVKDRTRNNTSFLFDILSKVLDADPASTLHDIVERIYSSVRSIGEEVVAYTSEDGVAKRVFLL